MVTLMMVFAGPAVFAETPSADSSATAADTAKDSGFAGPCSVVGTMKKEPGFLLKTAVPEKAP